MSRAFVFRGRAHSRTLFWSSDTHHLTVSHSVLGHCHLGRFLGALPKCFLNVYNERVFRGDVSRLETCVSGCVDMTDDEQNKFRARRELGHMR